MESKSLQATEELGAAGAKEFRITLDYIKSQIRSIYWMSGYDFVHSAGTAEHNVKYVDHKDLETSTICMIHMKNGFRVFGHSAPLSVENFDPAKGRTFAYEDAFRQLWPLFAFAVKEMKRDAGE